MKASVSRVGRCAPTSNRNTGRESTGGIKKALYRVRRGVSRLSSFRVRSCVARSKLPEKCVGTGFYFRRLPRGFPRGNGGAESPGGGKLHRTLVPFWCVFGIRVRDILALGELWWLLGGAWRRKVSYPGAVLGFLVSPGGQKSRTLRLLAAPGGQNSRTLLPLASPRGQKSRTLVPAAAPGGQKSRTLMMAAALGGQKSRTPVLAAAPEGQKSRTLVLQAAPVAGHHRINSLGRRPGDEKSRTLAPPAAPNGQKSRTLAPPAPKVSYPSAP